MINAEEFTKRLQKVMDYYEETASSFAVKIDVQRSSISHILSGRNKPSLDFVMKVLHAYPEVELYWLINGKGNFPNQKKIEPLLKKATLEKSETFIPSPQATKDSENSKIERIVIFYKDGSFKSYEN
jgi:transcriptional regulator with XRE-family HTH domain